MPEHETRISPSTTRNPSTLRTTPGRRSSSPARKRTRDEGRRPL